ncbi:MAG: helix-turn-helix domain-containing protein [Waterburya sp.]|jgi:Helix-turn-helix
MSLNTIDNVYSEQSTASFLATSQLKLNRLKSETIQNNKTKSELNLIYLEDSVILQVKEKNQPCESYYGFDPEVAKRIKLAWEWEAEDELIAIASTSEDALFVMGCDLKTWEIPFKSFPCFNQVSQSERGNFELDEDGSYLYWKNVDLHLDLEAFKAAVDSEFKAELLAEKQEYGKSFGRAIAIVRKAHKLNQDGIDGISDRHLRRIENEGQQPTLDALKKLAKAHKISLEDYLAKVNEALININDKL